MTAAALDLDDNIDQGLISLMLQNHIVAALRYTRNTVPAEIDLLSANNINAVMIAEWSGDHYSYYSFEQGQLDAHKAFTQATALGMPENKGIYFCMDDFDANVTQITGHIRDYLVGVNSVLTNTKCGVGGYGNGLACATHLDSGLIQKAFVWGALGTNGTRAFIQSNRWSIRQYPTTRLGHYSIDMDDVQGDYWGWTKQNVQLKPVSTTLSYSDIQILVNKYINTHKLNLANLVVDGIPGYLTRNAVKAVQQSAGILADGVVGPITTSVLLKV